MSSSVCWALRIVTKTQHDMEEEMCLYMNCGICIYTGTWCHFLAEILLVWLSIYTHHGHSTFSRRILWLVILTIVIPHFIFIIDVRFSDGSSGQMSPAAITHSSPDLLWPPLTGIPISVVLAVDNGIVNLGSFFLVIHICVLLWQSLEPPVVRLPHNLIIYEVFLSSDADFQGLNLKKKTISLQVKF